MGKPSKIRSFSHKKYKLYKPLGFRSGIFHDFAVSGFDYHRVTPATMARHPLIYTGTGTPTMLAMVTPPSLGIPHERYLNTYSDLELLQDHPKKLQQRYAL